MRKKAAKQTTSKEPSTTKIPFASFESVGDSVEGPLNGIWKSFYGINYQIGDINVAGKTVLNKLIKKAINDKKLNIGSEVSITLIGFGKGKAGNPSKLFKLIVNGEEIKDDIGKISIEDAVQYL
jgi:hypothetical protein